MIPYLLVNVIAFYILPMCMQDTGSAMLVLLIVTPFLCLVTAIVFGIKKSFHWVYPLAVALLFTPTVFIFYNESAAIYIVAYGIIALIGNLIGKVFYKRINAHDPHPGKFLN